MLPRTTRAQAMDVLSSQANIAGYKAVLLAANSYGRYFPMFMTALRKYCSCQNAYFRSWSCWFTSHCYRKRLGAVVEVFDTRPAVKEEVMSLGAKFVEVEGAADASTAGGYAVEQTEEYKQSNNNESLKVLQNLILSSSQQHKFLEKSPILITEEMLNSMRNGSVIIDLAASTGGNTPFTKNNETVNYNGVSIIEILLYNLPCLLTQVNCTEKYCEFLTTHH